MKKVLLSWSSGKDAVWALHLLRQQPDIEVVALVTTFNTDADRVAMHSVRRSLAKEQAERAGLPLWEVELPWPCPNSVYESRMRSISVCALDRGIEAIAFGDLFLEDIRSYRETRMSSLGLELLFPVWRFPTDRLARDMIAAGVKAKIICVDPSVLPASFAGRDFDLDFLADLPVGVDPCGENGEFHTFVYDAPEFSSSISVRTGEITERDGYVYADLIPA